MDIDELEDEQRAEILELLDALTAHLDTQALQRALALTESLSADPLTRLLCELAHNLDAARELSTATRDARLRDELHAELNNQNSKLWK